MKFFENNVAPIAAGILAAGFCMADTEEAKAYLGFGTVLALAVTAHEFGMFQIVGNALDSILGHSPAMSMDEQESEAHEEERRSATPM